MENQKQFYVFANQAMVPVSSGHAIDPKVIWHDPENEDVTEALVQINFWTEENNLTTTKRYTLKGTNFDHDSAYQAIFTVIRWMLASGCPFIPVDRICSDVIGRRLNILEDGSIDAFAKQVYEELLVQV